VRGSGRVRRDRDPHEAEHRLHDRARFLVTSSGPPPWPSKRSRPGTRRGQTFSHQVRFDRHPPAFLFCTSWFAFGPGCRVEWKRPVRVLVRVQGETGSDALLLGTEGSLSHRGSESTPPARATAFGATTCGRRCASASVRAGPRHGSHDGGIGARPSVTRRRDRRLFRVPGKAGRTSAGITSGRAMSGARLAGRDRRSYRRQRNTPSRSPEGGVPKYAGNRDAAGQATEATYPPAR
jgi:hypothetical protein